MPIKFDFKAHHKVKTKDGRVGYKETPWIRFKHGEEPPVIVQGGSYFSGGGTPIDEANLPSWVKEEVRKLNPDARESVGLPRRMAAKPHESVAK